MLVRRNTCYFPLLWLFALIICCEGRILPSWFWHSSSISKHFGATSAADKQTQVADHIFTSKPIIAVRRREVTVNSTQSDLELSSSSFLDDYSTTEVPTSTDLSVTDVDTSTEDSPTSTTEVPSSSELYANVADPSSEDFGTQTTPSFEFYSFNLDTSTSSPDTATSSSPFMGSDMKIVSTSSSENLMSDYLQSSDVSVSSGEYTSSEVLTSSDAEDTTSTTSSIEEITSSTPSAGASYNSRDAVSSSVSVSVSPSPSQSESSFTDTSSEDAPSLSTNPVDTTVDVDTTTSYTPSPSPSPTPSESDLTDTSTETSSSSSFAGVPIDNDTSTPDDTVSIETTPPETTPSETTTPETTTTPITNSPVITTSITTTPVTTTPETTIPETTTPVTTTPVTTTPVTTTPVATTPVTTTPVLPTSVTTTPETTSPEPTTSSTTDTAQAADSSTLSPPSTLSTAESLPVTTESTSSTSQLSAIPTPTTSTEVDDALTTTTSQANTTPLTTSLTTMLPSETGTTSEPFLTFVSTEESTPGSTIIMDISTSSLDIVTPTSGEITSVVPVSTSAMLQDTDVSSSTPTEMVVISSETPGASTILQESTTFTDITSGSDIIQLGRSTTSVILSSMTSDTVASESTNDVAMFFSTESASTHHSVVSSSIITQPRNSDTSASLISETRQSMVASVSATPDSSIANSGLASNTDWLPTTLVIEPTAAHATSATTSADLGATSTLPQAINPASDVPLPDGYTVITVGFKEPLNYPFLIANPLASAQIFNFLPKVLVRPFQLTTTGAAPVYRRSWDIIKRGINTHLLSSSLSTYDDVQVKSIVPLVIQNVSYIVSIAEVYFPTESVHTLQELVLDSNSILYSNPVSYLADLASLINPAIPLTGLTYSGSSGSSGGNGSGGDSNGNGNGSGEGTSGNGAEKDNSSNNPALWGSLDAGLTSGFPNHDTVIRFVCMVTVLTAFIIFLVSLILVLLKKIYKRTNCAKRMHLTEKNWPDIPAFYSHHMNGSTDSPMRNVFYSGSQFSGSDTTEEDSHSAEYIDDDLIITGENTVYSISQGITYYVDEDGNFFFAGVGKNVHTNEPEKMEKITHDKTDTVTVEPILPYYNEKDDDFADEAEPFDMGELEVDEDGNIALPESDLENTILQVASEREELRNRSPIGTNDGSDLLNQIPNIFPSVTSNSAHLNSDTMATAVTQTLLSSNGSGGIMDLTDNSGTYNEYLYDATQDEIDDPPIIANSGLEEFSSGHISSIDLDDGIDIDIEDYDDDVSDVNVGDYDEFDEEMYRHLSRSDILQNFGSDSSTGLASRLASLQGTSTDSGTSFNMHNVGSYIGAYTSTLSSNGRNPSDNSYGGVPPKRPERSSLVFDFNSLYDETPSLNRSASMASPNQTPEKHTNSKPTSRNLSKEFAAELGITEEQLKTMERHPSVPSHNSQSRTSNKK